MTCRTPVNDDVNLARRHRHGRAWEQLGRSNEAPRKRRVLTPAGWFWLVVLLLYMVAAVCLVKGCSG